MVIKKSADLLICTGHSYRLFTVEVVICCLLRQPATRSVKVKRVSQQRKNQYKNSQKSKRTIQMDVGANEVVEILDDDTSEEECNVSNERTGGTVENRCRTRSECLMAEVKCVKNCTKRVSKQEPKKVGTDAIDVIDLLDVDISEDEYDNSSENSHASASEVEGRRRKPSNNAMTKMTCVKKCRRGRLQVKRPGSADIISFSLFSVDSRVEYCNLDCAQKRTYVGSSTNPFLGNALFAGEKILKGEFICLYIGMRMSYTECKARIKAGRIADYMLDVTRGVVIDGYEVGQGAAMANHSCDPNASLEHHILKGSEKAPVGMLMAIKDIEVSDEIEANYRFWDPVEDGIPDLNDTSSYVRCRCLKKNCLKVMKLND